MICRSMSLKENEWIQTPSLHQYRTLNPKISVREFLGFRKISWRSQGLWLSSSRVYRRFGREKWEEAHSKQPVSVMVKIDPTQTGVEPVRSFKQHILKNRGKSPIHLPFHAPGRNAQVDLPKELKVDGSPQLTAEGDCVFVQRVATLQ